MSTPAYALAGLTADQHKVLSALAKGASITAAAQCAAVHRTTIHHWSRHQPDFRNALDNARSAYRASIQIEYEELADAALATVKGILNDPKASPAVRLKAALAILNKVVNEPVAQTPSHGIRLSSAEPDPTPAPAPEPTDADIDADLTQMEQALGLTTEADAPEAHIQPGLADPDYLQPVETIRRAGPKVGRNDQCPCGSNRKHKKCCGR